MNPKPLANHSQRLVALRQMTPAERLRQALELSEFTRYLFKKGLRARFHNMRPDQFHQLYLKRLAGCHNRNY